MTATPLTRCAAIATIACALLIPVATTHAQGDIVLPEGLHARVVHADPAMDWISGIQWNGTDHLYVTRDNASVGVPQLDDLDLTTDVVTTLMAGLPLAAPDRMILGDGGALLGDDLILVDHNSMGTVACCNGSVFRIDRTTFEVTTVTQGNPEFPSSGDPTALATGSGAFGDALYVLDFEGASLDVPVLYRVWNDGSRETFVVDAGIWDTSAKPIDMAFDPSGDYGDDLYITDDGTDSQIWRVSPNGDATPFVDFANPKAIDFGHDGLFGSSMYVLGAAGGSTKLYQVDASGTKTEFGTGFRSTQIAMPDLLFSDDGQQLYISIEDHIYVVEADDPFRRGDCNTDGSIDISDAIFALGALFSGGAQPICDDACDNNDDGGVDIGDAVFLLANLFSGGAPIPAPTTCGSDPTPDTLSCVQFAPCL